MAKRGRRPGPGGYKPGALMTACERWLYRHESGTAQQIAADVGSDPIAVRNALYRLGAVHDGVRPFTWRLRGPEYRREGS